MNTKVLRSPPSPAVASDLWSQALAVRHHPIWLPHAARCGLTVLLRRDDQLSPLWGGNKAYKLHYTIRRALDEGKHTLVTQGGAWSNHLYALAHAGRAAGLATRALVRGQPPRTLSPTLADAQAQGMELIFVDRHAYRQLANSPPPVDSGELFIPEGGASADGERGARLLGRAIGARGHFHVVATPVGTGGTLRGVAGALDTGQRAVGFSVLKGDGPLQRPDGHRWRVIRGYHGGGYARRLPEPLRQFWRAIEIHNRVAFDPVYTLKMLWGIDDLAARGYWQPGTRLLALHTGGLQGRRGFQAQIDWDAQSGTDNHNHR